MFVNKAGAVILWLNRIYLQEKKENLHFKIAGHDEKINNLDYMRDIAVVL